MTDTKRVKKIPSTAKRATWTDEEKKVYHDYQKEYYQRKKEKMKAHSQANRDSWDEEKKAKHKAYMKEYYQKNREKLLKQLKEHYHVKANQKKNEELELKK